MSEIHSSATPVIAQYLTVKSEHQECLLFFRMGDFYELFFEDAEIAAKELDIILTKRGKYKDADIPMCGVPVHNYAVYTERLVKKGYHIAVCEQLESPETAKKRGTKSVVKRDVVRILTAGTLTEDHMLDPVKHNFIVAVTQKDHKICAFRYDMSAGKNAVTIMNAPSDFANYCARIMPAEILYAAPEDTKFLKDIVPDYTASHQPIMVTEDERLEGLSLDEKQGGLLLLSYLAHTQKGGDYLWLPTEFESFDKVMSLDNATLKNLEILQSSEGTRKNALIDILDNCATKGGSRLLSERLTKPLMDRILLEERYEAVKYFIKNYGMTETIKENFKRLPDLARILGRIQAGRGTPADLGAVRETVTIIYDVLRQVNIENLQGLPSLLQKSFEILCTDFASYHLILSALTDQPPVTLKFGGFIEAGYDAILDGYVDLRDNAQGYILALETEYKQLTDITALKIKHNNVIGYHIDVPALHADKMLQGDFGETSFIHKQTLANNIRFTTDALIKLEKKIIEAEANFKKREAEIFDILIEAVKEDIYPLASFAEAFAEVDLYASHSIFVQDHDYVCPELVDEKTLQIKKSRHPVIEHILKKQSSKSFVPNDCSFLKDAKKKTTELWLLSGPNMGGKSTYLRQNAVAILMAQAGLFVAAKSYKASLFDAVYSRVGASDNLSKGQSTFMMEMSEMAYILRNATSRSFVILDEVGRGTSTYDGLAVAYATTEYLMNDVNCLGIFATHYHELTDLTEASKRVGHLQVLVTEYKDEIIFLHQITAGAAKKSYGVHVAELAGMPQSVVKFAKDFLKKTNKTGTVSVPDTAPLFQVASTTQNKNFEEIENILQQTDLNHLSPIEAFALLEKLKNMALQDGEA